MNASNPIVSVIVVNYHSLPVLRRCLQQLDASQFAGELEILVVDNSPGDGTAEALPEAFPHVTLLQPGTNLGFGPACNFGFRHARGAFVLLLNPDAFVPPDAVQAAYDYFLSHDHVGVVGVRLVGEGGAWHPSARRFPTVFDKLVVLSGLAARFPRNRLLGRLDYTWWDHAQPRAVDWVVGAFFMIRAETMRRLDGFDERFFIYFEEMEFCKRVKRAGKQVHFVPCAEVHHVGGVSSSGDHMDPAAVEGKQISHFRMFSEALYYGKYYGRAGAAIMLGIEWAWTYLRALRNRLGGEARRAKREALELLARKIRFALRETRWGTVAPPAPWSARLEDYPGWEHPS